MYLSLYVGWNRWLCLKPHSIPGKWFENIEHSLPGFSNFLILIVFCFASPSDNFLKKPTGHITLFFILPYLYAFKTLSLNLQLNSTVPAEFIFHQVFFLHPMWYFMVSDSHAILLMYFTFHSGGAFLRIRGRSGLRFRQRWHEWLLLLCQFPSMASWS